MEDPSLEVILRIKTTEKLIGRITSIDASKYRARQVSFQLATGEMDDGIEIMTSATFVIEHKNVVMSRFDRDRGEVPFRGVPSYAQGHIDMMRDVIRYTWPALIIDRTQVELVFDHPDFEPA